MSEHTGTLLDDPLNEDTRPRAGWVATHTEPGQDRFAVLTAAWLAGYSSPRTVKAYAADIVAFQAWLASLSPSPAPLLVDEVHLRGYAEWLRAAGLDERTRRRKIAAVSSLYRFAVAAGERDANPAARVARPPEPPRRARRLSAAQAAQLLGVIDSSTHEQARRDRVIARLLLRAEVRVGQICAANLGDLLLYSGQLRVRVPDSAGSHRLVDLDTGIVTALHAYLPYRADPLPRSIEPAGHPAAIGELRDPLFYLQYPRRHGQRVSAGSRLTRDALAARLQSYATECPGIDADQAAHLGAHDLLGVLADRA